MTINSGRHHDHAVDPELLRRLFGLLEIYGSNLPFRLCSALAGDRDRNRGPGVEHETQERGECKFSASSAEASSKSLLFSRWAG
jgi:hypothetical protein